MIDFLLSDSVSARLFIIFGSLVLTVLGIVLAWQWRKVRQTELELSFKQQLAEQHWTPADIQELMGLRNHADNPPRPSPVAAPESANERQPPANFPPAPSGANFWSVLVAIFAGLFNWKSILAFYSMVAVIMAVTGLTHRSSCPSSFPSHQQTSIALVAAGNRTEVPRQSGLSKRVVASVSPARPTQPPHAQKEQGCDVTLHASQGSGLFLVTVTASARGRVIGKATVTVAVQELERPPASNDPGTAGAARRARR